MALHATNNTPPRSRRHCPPTPCTPSLPTSTLHSPMHSLPLTSMPLPHALPPTHLNASFSLPLLSSSCRLTPPPPRLRDAPRGSREAVDVDAEKGGTGGERREGVSGSGSGIGSECDCDGWHAKPAQVQATCECARLPHMHAPHTHAPPPLTFLFPTPRVPPLPPPPLPLPPRRHPPRLPPHADHAALVVKHVDVAVAQQHLRVVGSKTLISIIGVTSHPATPGGANNERFKHPSLSPNNTWGEWNGRSNSVH